MGILIYKEQDYPFNVEFDYVVKDDNGKEFTHSITVKLNEKQLSEFDMTDKNAQDVMEAMTADKLAKMIFTDEQIKEVKANTNNDYQFKTILTNISGHIMGFINMQRVESSLAAMNSSPAMKKYNKFISAAQNTY